jgi:hypothetical protein
MIVGIRSGTTTSNSTVVSRKQPAIRKMTLTLKRKFSGESSIADTAAASGYLLLGGHGVVHDDAPAIIIITVTAACIDSIKIGASAAGLRSER